MKTLVQCDFDGTVTGKDVSFLLLDAFADMSWRQLLKEYNQGRISVGAFNRRAFAMIKADRNTLIDFVLNSGEVTMRPGFSELLNYCAQNGLEFVIVSNGQDFYIDAILARLGVNQVKAFAARSRFRPEGMEVNYVGPDGTILEEGFKEAYTRLFLEQGYYLVYVGNGASDIYSARLAHQVFATGDLLEQCKREGLDCTPFADLNDVVSGLKLIASKQSPPGSGPNPLPRIE